MLGRLWVVVALLLPAATVLAVDEFEEAPITYSKSTPRNAVSALAGRVGSGETHLAYDEEFGYLKSLLAALEVPPSSQMLVYSKTSLQRQYISPSTPRAIYFSDDVYVGYCQGGDVLEISVADTKLGTVYYTLDQTEQPKPDFVRQTDNCLICHGSSQTHNVPGHVVRSVFADLQGQPILASGTYRIDHTSPFEQRWGGWYVTGTHGGMKHLGNQVIVDKRDPERQDNSANMNLTELHRRVDREAYLTPHSDIVALMVMEHQTMAHNHLVRANFTARQAEQYQKTFNKELGYPDDHVFDSTISRIKSAGEPLVKCLLFCEEAPLTARVTGTSDFAKEFASHGRRDSGGRSLRDFDLEKRMFKYPLSYLIYNESFDQLPPAMLDYVWKRLHEVLSGTDQSKEFSHLTAEDRAAIMEILKETKQGLPEYFCE